MLVIFSFDTNLPLMIFISVLFPAFVILGAAESRCVCFCFGFFLFLTGSTLWFSITWGDQGGILLFLSQSKAYEIALLLTKSYVVMIKAQLVCGCWGLSFWMGGRCSRCSSSFCKTCSLKKGFHANYL